MIPRAREGRREILVGVILTVRVACAQWVIQQPRAIRWNAEHGGLIRSDVQSSPRKHCAAPLKVKTNVEPDVPTGIGPAPPLSGGHRIALTPARV